MELNRATHERSFWSASSRFRRNVSSLFPDPAKKRKWFRGREGAKIESYELDFRVGGKEITADAVLRFPRVHERHLFLVIVPNHRIVIAYTMSMNNTVSSSQATFELVPVQDGSTLVFTEQAAFFEKSTARNFAKKLAPAFRAACPRAGH